MMLNLEIGRVSIIHTQNISLFYYSMKHILFILEVFPQQHKASEMHLSFDMSYDILRNCCNTYVDIRYCHLGVLEFFKWNVSHSFLENR